jgi:xanthine dehydrogenase accessory factor
MQRREFYSKALEALESGRACHAVTVVSSERSTPQKPGAKMLVFADGSIWGTIGGGDVERMIIEQIRNENPREPLMIRYTLNEQGAAAGGPKMSCGGVMEFFVEPLGESHVLYILGGGHCGIELSKLAAHVGFSVTVLDNRADWATREEHPLAARVICAPYAEIEQHIHFSPEVYVVIMTHNHEHDEQALRICLNHEAQYLGVIGSKTKAALLKQRLAVDGISEDRLKHVHLPVGLDIGSHTPEEIAVSITAELISVRQGEK